MKQLCPTGLLLCWLAVAPTANAQAADASAGAPSRELSAQRLPVGTSISVDGRLGDTGWANAEVATDFVQLEPNAGLPSTERTEAFIAFDASSIYVAFKAYVQDPTKLVRKLVRRDNFDAFSDRVFVEIGSPVDGRTAFSFGVNLAGVQQDALLFDDSDSGDNGWDAVWDSAVGRFSDETGQGYIAEIRIPLSQLRYDPKGTKPWQIQFERDIAVNGERSFWAPLETITDGYVSRFGTINGLTGLRTPRRLEILPYVSTRLTREPGDAADPYFSTNATAQQFGLDAKFGLSNALTLTTTINPDFGQVEQDPAVVNLTDFEVRVGERRPFFVEGSDVFAFGSTRGNRATDRPTYFYSRRIGREPLPFGSSDASVLSRADYFSSPAQTTIAAAGKISGQVGAWSLGVLNVVTAPERASFVDTTDTEGSLLVEPGANFLVGRARRNWRGGATLAGGFVSSVLRNTSAGFEPLLASDALVAGVDAEHGFGDRTWTVSGVVSGSFVRGSSDFITGQQRSSRRYFQRSDADYLEIDADRTSLSGYRSEFALAKTRGRFWRGSLTLGATSPGFEANDLGFQTRADQLSADWQIDYTHTSPKASWLNRVNAIVYGTQARNYGGDHISHRYAGTFNLFFSNLWLGQVAWSARPEYVNDRLTRGGPIGARPADGSLQGFVRSNQARRLSFEASVAGRTEFYTQPGVRKEWTFTSGGQILVRPSNALDFALVPSWARALNTDQFIRSVAFAGAPEGFGGRRYVFSDVRSESVSLGLRTNWSFTSNLTFQLYLAPSVDAYAFSNYRQLAARQTYSFNRFGEELGTVTSQVFSDAGVRAANPGERADQYLIDPQDGGAAFIVPNRDFTYLSLRGNAVLRWAWRPGSEVFFVWQQTRDDANAFTGLDVLQDLPGILSTDSRNVFLLKATYWFGL